MDVLSLLDAVIPDIEMEVGKRVTRSLARGEVIAAEWMYHPYHFEMYQS